MLRRKRQIRNNRKRRKKIRNFLGLFIVFTILSIGAGFVISRNHAILIRPIPDGPLFQVLGSSDGVVKQIEKALKEQRIEYKEVKKIAPSTYQVTLQTGEEILLTDTKDLPSQLSSLQVIMLHLTMEGKRFSKLDLRFDRPVIVLAK